MKKGICCVTHKTFRKIFSNTFAEPMRTCSSTLLMKGRKITPGYSNSANELWQHERGVK